MLFRRSSMVEQEAVNFKVVGSSPTAGAFWTRTSLIFPETLVFFTVVRIRHCLDYYFRSYFIASYLSVLSVNRNIKMCMIGK